MSDGKSAGAGGPRVFRQQPPALGGGANVPRDRQESVESLAEIARLKARIETLNIDKDNLKTYIAAIVLQKGGMAQIGPEELLRSYEMFISHDQTTNIVTFVAAIVEGQPQ